MDVIKRSGKKVKYQKGRILNAIRKVAESVKDGLPYKRLEELTDIVDRRVKEKYEEPHVEQIQDIVENVLIEEKYTDMAKSYILYREKHAQDRKEWIKDKLPLSIWTRKYQFDGESFEEFFERVAGGNEIIRKFLKRKRFVPAGRILANRGLHKKGIKISYSNCYVTRPPEDNLESIFDTAKRIARTFSYGGGTGIDISKLRPRGARVNNAAKTTTGSVSFLDIYDITSKKIGQKGRRAALMVSIRADHPDIEDFVDKKMDLKTVNKANMSVRVDNKFMQAVSNEDKYELNFYVEDTGEKIQRNVEASKIFNKIAYANWYMGEPGCLFWDRIKNWNLLSEDEEFEYAGTNPCGEEPLPAGGSCLLGSINLDRYVEKPFTDQAIFNFEDFSYTVKQAVIYLNEILEEGLPLHPLKKQRESVSNWRQIGLGQMGLGSMLIKMKLRYGEKPSLDLCDKIGKIMINSALQQSALLARKDGPYPKYKKEAILNSDFFRENATEETKKLVEKHGLRNSQLLTIAPTGSTSNLVGVSGGIEPIFKVSYTRKTETLYDKETEYEIFDSVVEEYMERENIKDKNNLPDFIVDAHELDYKKRIDMQAVWQKYIDASISSTINLDNNKTVNEIKDLYKYAWEKGLKGVTIYRDGCAREGILTGNENTEGKTEMTAQEFIDQGICPECKAKLYNTVGCKECRECGFSVC
ncbi:MAG: adenosylcobalamin-dependent ribonucleoside-diphosphate reductase [Bacillota bacterium]